MRAVEDYEGFYRARLAKRHRYMAVPPDGRLWTAADIAALDEAPPPSAEAEEQHSSVVRLFKKKRKGN